MSLQELSTEDLVKEIQRRKSAEVGELRRQIDEHKKAIRELEDRIRARGEGEATPRRGRAASSSIPAGERSERAPNDGGLRGSRRGGGRVTGVPRGLARVVSPRAGEQNDRARNGEEGQSARCAGSRSHMAMDGTVHAWR